MKKSRKYAFLRAVVAWFAALIGVVAIGQACVAAQRNWRSK